MPTSINGWPVLDNPVWGDPRAKKAILDGIGTQLWVQRDCWPLFAAIVRDYDKAINNVPRMRAWMFSSVVSSCVPSKSALSEPKKASNSGTIDTSS